MEKLISTCNRATIQTMHHEFVGMYEQDNVVIAEAEVTFIRLDNKGV
jgi:hypothetical protein